MNTHTPSIRQFVRQTIKEFPWAYAGQGERLAAYADYLIGGRDTSWTSYERVGIEEFSARQLGYSLLRGEFHLELLKQACIRRFTKLDRREVITLAFDDTNEVRYGSHVFGAARQFDHSGGGIQYGNVIVDCWITALSHIDYEFQVYLPKNYLEREVGHMHNLETKIEMTRQMVQNKVKELLAQGVRLERIWLTLDSWYACGTITDDIREMGIKMMMNIKKGIYCDLFGESIRVDELFAQEPEWHYRTHPRTGKKFFFKEKILNLSTMGKCKVFAVRRGNEQNIRYYASPHTKLTFPTLLRRWREHWGVETLHAGIKKRFALGGCYSGREIINLAYWNIVYLLSYLFRVYQRSPHSQETPVSLKQLWEWYCLEYDTERAQKHFRTVKQVKRAQQRLSKGWCYYCEVKF